MYLNIKFSNVDIKSVEGFYSLKNKTIFDLHKSFLENITYIHWILFLNNFLIIIINILFHNSKI